MMLTLRELHLLMLQLKPLWLCWQLLEPLVNNLVILSVFLPPTGAKQSVMALVVPGSLLPAFLAVCLDVLPPFLASPLAIVDDDVE